MIPMILYPHKYGVAVTCPCCGGRNKIPPQPAELVTIADRMLLFCCNRTIFEQDKLENLKEQLKSFAVSFEDEGGFYFLPTT